MVARKPPASPKPVAEGGKPNPGTKPDGRLAANKAKGGNKK